MVEELLAKMILVGEPGVGKTSLVKRYVHGKFKKSYMMTIGVDICAKTLSLGDFSLTLSINDIGGQKSFQMMRHIFFGGTQLAMLVYDVTRPASLDSLKNSWYPDVIKHNQDNRFPVVFLMVGNKVDLEDMRMISKKEGESVAKDLGCIAHFETSAKQDQNVETAFIDLGNEFLKVIS